MNFVISVIHVSKSSPCTCKDFFYFIGWQGNRLDERRVFWTELDPKGGRSLAKWKELIGGEETSLKVWGVSCVTFP